MATFTSTLPNDILKQLDTVAKSLNVPKNRLIEKALRIYLDQLKRAEYVKSYRNINDELMSIAEEGMAEYCKDINAE